MNGWAFSPITEEFVARPMYQGCALRWMNGWAFGPITGELVGATGWQLSHGEKSRLYIARALLQRADLIVLDESFAALDPQTLEKTLSYVLQRAPTVLVIAHP